MRPALWCNRLNLSMILKSHIRVLTQPLAHLVPICLPVNVPEMAENMAWKLGVYNAFGKAVMKLQAVGLGGAQTCLF